jgi:8-oxo-dGTP pyrophosphatase MutT (NUDIX family)
MARSYLALGRLLENMQRANPLMPASPGPKASVAAIFRFAHPKASSFTHVPPPTPLQSVPTLVHYLHGQDYIGQNWTQESELQMLFIKRSETPLDRHSGQIALPGGKQDPGENQYQCAVREAW